MGGQRGPKSNPELEHGKCISSHTLSIQTLRLGMHSGVACPLRTYFVPEAELIVCQNGVNGCVCFASGVNRQRRDKAPCFAMSEYDFPVQSAFSLNAKIAGLHARLSSEMMVSRLKHTRAQRARDARGARRGAASPPPYL